MPEPLGASDPRKLGPYTLTKRLGEGELGVVYHGRDRSGTAVAIKLLKSDLQYDPEPRQRFNAAIETSAQVQSPYVARVIESDIPSERPYVVSEFVDGPSLSDVVPEQGAFHGEVLERIAVGTAQGLLAIHAVGLAHQDLKPSNVLLGPAGPCVVDHAIATALHAGGAIPGKTSPAFQAPEQFPAYMTGAAVGPAADVFSWASTMVYAATGRGPFGTDAPRMMLINLITEGEPELNGVPDSLRDLLLRCLSKAPADRPSIAEVLEQLPRLPELDPPEPQPETATGAAAGAAAGAAGATLFVPNEPPPWEPIADPSSFQPGEPYQPQEYPPPLEPPAPYESPYLTDPPYSEQSYPVDRPAGYEQPYSNQPYPDQPLAEQPYGLDQPYPMEQPLPEPAGFPEPTGVDTYSDAAPAAFADAPPRPDGPSGPPPIDGGPAGPPPSTGPVLPPPGPPGAPGHPAGPGPGASPAPDGGGGPIWSPEVELDLEEEGTPRRKLLLIGLAVVLVVGVLVGGFFVFQGVFGGDNTAGPDPRATSDVDDPEPKDKPSPKDSPASLPPPPSPEDRPVEGATLPGAADTEIMTPLNAGITLAAYQADDVIRVWNPTSGEYEETDLSGPPRVSPDGRWLAGVVNESGDVAIEDRSEGERRTVPTAELPSSGGGDAVSASAPVWSPNSKELLLRISEDDSPTGVVVVDVQTLKTRFVPIEGTRYVAWNADGSGFIANPAGDTRTPDLVFYDGEGNETDTIEEAGWLSDDGYGTFSPDGSRLVTYCSKNENRPRACVYDAETLEQQTVVPINTNSAPVDTYLLGWYDDTRLLADIQLIPKKLGRGTGAISLDGTPNRFVLRNGDGISTWFNIAPA